MMGTLVCLGKAFSGFAELDHMEDLVNYTLFQPKTEKEVDEILKNMEQDEQGTYRVTAWTRQQDVEFRVKDRNTKAKGALVEIKGDSSLLYSTAENLTREDTDGCLLTEGAAYELFGDTEVIGEVLDYQNKEKPYTIRGIIPGQENVFLIQARTESEKTDQNTSGTESASPGNPGSVQSEMTFDRLSVLVYETGEMERQELLKQFEEKYGITENDTKTDYEYYKNGGAFFICILPAAAFLMILYAACRAVWKSRRKPFRAAVYVILFLVIAGVFYLGSSSYYSISESWIPGQWSDYSFWGEKISGSIAQFKQMLFVSKDLVELEYYNKMLAIGLYTAGAVIFWILSVWNFRIQTAPIWYGSEILVMLLSAAVLYDFRKRGMILPSGWIWLALYPLYFISLFVYQDKET